MSVTTRGGLVFLGGIGSGGTDLLMNVMNAHPRVFIPGELPFLPRIADRFAPEVPPEEVGAVRDAMLRLDEYKTLTHHHWDNYRADRKDPVTLGPPPVPVDGRVSLAAIYRWMLGVPDGVWWTGNKTPTNTETADRLAAAFPAARFVIIVRDPRDVALSWRHRWGRDERLTADKWERRLAAGRRHLDQLPTDRHLTVHYEHLLDDLRGTAIELCRFLDLEFAEEMLSFHEHVTKTIGGQENRGRPLLIANHGKWRARMEPRLTRRIEEIAWEGMRVYGYPITRAAGPRSLTRLERARGRALDIRAVLTTGSRVQRINRRRDHVKRIVLQVKRRLFHRRITV